MAMASTMVCRCPVSSFPPQSKPSPDMRTLKSTIPSGAVHQHHHHLQERLLFLHCEQIGFPSSVGLSAQRGPVFQAAGLSLNSQKLTKTALQALVMNSGGFLKDMPAFPQGVKRNCLTRASQAGTEDAQSIERPVWQSKIASLSDNSTVAAVMSFPWVKVYGRFTQRVLDLLWIIVKWLAIPVSALSTLGELLYTLTAKKDIFIPLGILTGVLLAKIVGNASLDVIKELQDGRTSWPLIAMGMFFVLLKLPGPYYPSWAAAFLPHVANAGLVQTAFLLRDSHQMFV